MVAKVLAWGIIGTTMLFLLAGMILPLLSLLRLLVGGYWREVLAALVFVIGCLIVVGGAAASLIWAIENI